MSALREIAAVVGVQVDSKELGGLDALLDKVKGGLGALASAFAVHEAVEFIKQQIEVAEGLDRTSNRLGVAVDDLQRFQYAVRLTGGDVDEANRSLFFLNKAIGGATEAGGTNPFAALKIGIKDATGHVRSALDILPDLADKIAEAKSPAEQTAIAVSVFGKSALTMLPLLRRGREGVKELSDEFDDLGGGLSKDFVKQGTEAAEELRRLDLVTNGLKADLVVGIVPAVRTFVSWMIKGAAMARDLTQHTYLLQTAAVSLAGVLAYRLIPAISGGIGPLGALIKTAAPFVGIAALVAIVYLAFDDLWTMLKGGKSVIGDLIDKFEGVGAHEKIVRKVIDAWTDFKTVISGTGDAWDALNAAFDDPNSIFHKVSAWLDKVTRALKDFGLAFRSIKRVIVDGETLDQAKKEALDDLNGTHTYTGAEADERLGVGSNAPIPRDPAAFDMRHAPVPARDDSYDVRTVPVPGALAPTYVGGPTTVKVESTTNVKFDGASPLTPEQGVRAVKDAVKEGQDNTYTDAVAALRTGAPG